MNKIKYILAAVVLIFIVLLILSNLTFLVQKESIGLNLFFKNYQLPENTYGVFFGVCFFAGFLIAYFWGLLDRFKANYNIKKLNTTIALQSEKISVLESKLKSSKPVESTPVETNSANMPATVNDNSDDLSQEKTPEDMEEKAGATPQQSE